MYKMSLLVDLFLEGGCDPGVAVADRDGDDPGEGVEVAEVEKGVE